MFVVKGVENIVDCGEVDVSDDFEGIYEEWCEYMWSDVVVYFNFDIENSEDNKFIFLF